MRFFFFFSGVSFLDISHCEFFTFLLTFFFSFYMVDSEQKNFRGFTLRVSVIFSLRFQLRFLVKYFKSALLVSDFIFISAAACHLFSLKSTLENGF